MASISYRIIGIDKETNIGELVIQLIIAGDYRPRFRTGLKINANYFCPVQKIYCGNVYDVVAPQINKSKTNVEEVMQVREIRDNLHIMANKILRICEHLQSFPDIEITEELVRGALDRLGEFKPLSEEMTFLHITEVLGGTAEINDVWSGGEPFFKLLILMLKVKGSTSSNPKNYTRNYMALFRLAKRYELYTRISDTARRDFILDPRTMTTEILEDLRVYMITEHDLYRTCPDVYERIAVLNPDCMSNVTHRHYPIRKKGENYIKTILEYLKTFFHWMNNMGYTENWPFKGFKIGGPKYGDPYYLTIDERNIVADYDLSHSERLSELRDAFIFQCLTGCRFSDLKALTRKNISNGKLCYIPLKTSGKSVPNMAIVPLCERVKNILKDRLSNDRDTLFNLPVDAGYNEGIQTILTICGIQRPVIFRDPKTGEYSCKPINQIATSHIARRTFVGNAYKKVKDPNLIGKMSGHVEGSRSFMRYRTIDEDDLREIINSSCF